MINRKLKKKLYKILLLFPISLFLDCSSNNGKTSANGGKGTKRSNKKTSEIETIKGKIPKSTGISSSTTDTNNNTNIANDVNNNTNTNTTTTIDSTTILNALKGDPQLMKQIVSCLQQHSIKFDADHYDTNTNTNTNTNTDADADHYDTNTDADTDTDTDIDADTDTDTDTDPTPTPKYGSIGDIITPKLISLKFPGDYQIGNNVYARKELLEHLNQYLSNDGVLVLFISNLFRNLLKSLFSKEELELLDTEVLGYLKYFIDCLATTETTYNITPAKVTNMVLLMNESINAKSALKSVKRDLGNIMDELKEANTVDNGSDGTKIMISNFKKNLRDNKARALNYPETLKESDQGISEKDISIIEKEEQKTGQFLDMVQKALLIYCTTILLYKVECQYDKKLINVLMFIKERLGIYIEAYKIDPRNIEVWRVDFAERVYELIKDHLKEVQGSGSSKILSAGKILLKKGKAFLDKIGKNQQLP